jgi:hypothetical protein
MNLDVTVSVELNRQELWEVLESLPSNSSKLYDRLSALRVAFERPLHIYGNGAKIRSVNAVHEYHNKESA